jgi:cytochrome c oxidase subunit 1
MHRAGLAGVPRRTAEPEYSQVTYDPVLGGMTEMQIQIAVGAILLFTSLSLFLVVMAATWRNGSVKPILVDGYLPEPLSGPEHGPTILDNYRLWFAIAALLVVIAYGVPLWDMVADGLLAPGSGPISP